MDGEREIERERVREIDNYTQSEKFSQQKNDLYKTQSLKNIRYLWLVFLEKFWKLPFSTEYSLNFPEEDPGSQESSVQTLSSVFNSTHKSSTAVLLHVPEAPHRART